jgi:hypothetical protein
MSSNTAATVMSKATLPDGLTIEAGRALKASAGRLTILFSTPFIEQPQVIVSPFWEGQNAEVGHDETISVIDNQSFTVVSGNAAPNYFVNYIAVGRR